VDGRFDEVSDPAGHLFILISDHGRFLSLNIQHGPAMETSAKGLNNMSENYILDNNESEPEFIACALQVSCNGVNLCPDAESARARIAETIKKIEGYASTASNFLKWFYGVPVGLVALPEYAVTGFPMKESPAEWREKACMAYDGPEYEALGKIAQDNKIFLAGNIYEVDPNFPELYFQVCFIIGPSGDVILRYRRLSSSF
jgi:hypothetical protein